MIGSRGPDFSSLHFSGISFSGSYLNDQLWADQLWADPRLVYSVAVAAVGLLVATIWLFRRRQKQGRQAGIVCLVLSIALHAALIFLVPLLPEFGGGSPSVDAVEEQHQGVDVVSLSAFDPDVELGDSAGQSDVPALAPLPVSDLVEAIEEVVDIEPTEETTADSNETPTESSLPNWLATNDPTDLDAISSDLDDVLSEAIAVAEPTVEVVEQSVAPMPSSRARTPAEPKTVIGETDRDFANRSGSAKQQALIDTGGDANTEAAVQAALQFLAANQRADGAWDPQASGAGVERAPLGLTRGGAGTRAESAITGLALLSLLGAGQTHQQGAYADNVYRGLVYLMQTQKPDGSLAGKASVYASTYAHGMAALAICEAAAITGDPAAIDSAKRAIGHTRRMQHPTTGGWRYLQGDPGDLSQLGWQAMVLDAGHRAKIPIDSRTISGVHRFLRSVRMGNHGGLAAYRPGERASVTMTAEALATRLLIGQTIAPAEIEEAEHYLLQNRPGVGKDNYYYWYYATIALHQLQDDAWRAWNQALKQRLLATQRSDGSWSSDTMWGGYGGTVYTTSMATLCLETYYRHEIRGNRSRLADQNPSPTNR